jgi:hypothetical protein
MILDHADRNTKLVFLARRGERDDKADGRSESTENNDRPEKEIATSVLFRTDIDSHAAPPHLPDGVQARLFIVCPFLLLIPSVEILLHGAHYTKIHRETGPSPPMALVHFPPQPGLNIVHQAELSNFPVETGCFFDICIDFDNFA